MMLLVAMLAAVLNVADFGAAGDAQILACSTTASSTTIAVGGGSFGAGDVGKSAVLFHVGTVTSGTNREDFISTVASASGSNLVLNAAPTLSADQVRLILGTQNKTAFQNAINACASTDDTITIASGQYLFVPGTGPAITFSRGGIHFLGASATNTILLHCGAWQLVTGAAHRGELFWSQGPITNDYPLVFEDLTFDGGVENGLTGNHFFPSSATTGEGWDETHNAFKEAGGGLKQHSLKAFRNCVFRSWRGEVLIDNSAWTNSVNEVSNCIFYDCNASALNLAGAYQIHGTVSTNTYISMEWYSGYANTNCLMETSDWSTNIVIVGALSGHTQPPFLIRSNVFRGYIQCSPAANLQIINNIFLNSLAGVFVTSAGYQGTDHNHDFLIASNLFSGVYYPLALDGSANNRTENVAFTSNVSDADFTLVYGYGQNTGITISRNTAHRWIDDCRSWISPGQWAFDDGTSTSIQYWSDDNGAAISYSTGVRHVLTAPSSGFYTLDDTSPAMIPTGALLVLTCSQSPRIFASSVNYPNCYSRTISGTLRFAWTGTSWQPTDRIDATAVTVGALRGQ